jgi:ABC-type multidrug transport system fused ATPase/permease subunit
MSAISENSTTTSTLTLLLGIWSHLSARRRVQLGLLLIIMFSSSAAELVSLGAVIPFLAVLSDPAPLWQNPLTRSLITRLGFTQTSHLLLPATLAFVAAAVLAALIRLCNLWVNGRLAASVGSDLSCESYRRTLCQPYGVHVQRNSAVLITATTSHIGGTVAAITALLQVITALLVAFGLIIGLILIDRAVALAATALFATVYGLLAIMTRHQLHRNSQMIAEASRHQLQALQEGLGAIRDVLLNGNQPTYVEIYRQADWPQRKLKAKNQYLSASPRYALEALGMVAIALLGSFLVSQHGPGGEVVPLLGALALGAQRLLPALQQVYSGWASLRGYNASLASVLEMLNQPVPPPLIAAQPLLLRQSICLEAVHFGYQAEQPGVLRGLDLEIRRGERIGLIGTTGSGKSTTVDLLMGLLVPTTGRVLVDGDNLHDPKHPERLSAWRASLAHVPQMIYLADSSIAENIAFGVSRHQIDMDRVRLAAKQAQIASFIESTQEGYQSFVGERGIRLSGGQRQRIGIARALYKQSTVLVLDEATSALDDNTEEAVMNAIETLSQSVTIIMIAHRLSTLRRCNRIIRLAHGAVSSEGPSHVILAGK